MSKKLVSINLDEDLIIALDELAKTVGMSRSAVVNLVMRGTVMGETEETASLLVKTALDTNKANKKKLLKASSKA